MKMGTTNNEYPIEILVDIQEEEKNPLPVNKKKIDIFSGITKSDAKIQSFNSEENVASSKSSKRCETILDVSPSRISKKFIDNKESGVNLNQSLKSENLDDCPTAVLVDISPPRSCLKDSHVSTNTHHFTENKLNGCKTKDSHNSSNSSEVENQMPVRRLRWKTPSPQSMSRISKEASKIIDHLNSSIFNEESLLTEEILPLSLNFDEFDDDNADKENSIDNIFVNAILDSESSFSEKSLSKMEKTNDKSKDCSTKLTPEKNNLRQSSVEINIREASFEVSSKSASNSKDSDSVGIYGNSPVNSDSLTYSDEADDVFNVIHVASEDKENVWNKKNKLVFAKENKENKIATRNLLVNKSKVDQRGTLTNLSNIKQVKQFSVNKNVTTPLKRMSISTNKKAAMPHVEKTQGRKGLLSVDNHYSLKGCPKSKSFQFQNKKELIPNKQMPQPRIKIDSDCSSLSSAVKQHNNFATPSKRHSFYTPLKSASAIKPPLTPALSNSHNFVFPRYTPQPVKPSRLSFSSSWQPSGNTSQFFPTRGIKQQNSNIAPSSISKIASGVKNSSIPGKLSFSQSMSSVPVKSPGKNINKGRFAGRLLSPSSVQQDKKVARALFTSVSEK